MPIRVGFFAFLEDIGKQGDGFSNFGGPHLLMLAGLAVLTAALCVLYAKLPKRRRAAMLKILAFVIVGLEVAKQATFPLLHGQYWYFLLPLHFCGLSIAIEFVHAFWPNKTTGEILYCLCLPGAVMALLFSNWSMYTFNNFYCLQSFVIHALHIAFPLSLLITKEIVPDYKKLWRVVVFLAAVVPPIYLVNLRLGTNFFFINAGSEGSPLEIFIQIAGVPGFLLLYAGLVAFVWILMYAPWVIAGRKGRNGKPA